MKNKTNTITLAGRIYELCEEKCLTYCPHCHYSHYVYKLKRTYQIWLNTGFRVPVPRYTYYCTSSMEFFRPLGFKRAESDYIRTNVYEPEACAAGIERNIIENF